MGCWGVKLYEDDDTCDIKSDYKDFLSLGKSDEETLELFMGRQQDMLEDEDIANVFWLALADVMWNYGRLTEEVKEKAISIIESGKDLERWETELQKKKRNKELLKLKEKLETKQPERKKVQKIKKHTGQWHYGDILVHKITSENCVNEFYTKNVENSIYNNYFVVLKVEGIATSNRGALPREYDNECNVVSVYNVMYKNEPTLEEIEKLTDENLLTYYSDYDEKNKLFLKEYDDWNKAKTRKYFKLIKRINDNYNINCNHICFGFGSTDLEHFDYHLIRGFEYFNFKINFK